MIDWNRVAALREEVGPEDFGEVVDLFLMEVGEELSNLTDAADPKHLEEKLHFLKGCALNLGFRDFSALCQSGETALAKDPASDVDLAAIQATYQESCDAFLNDLPLRFAG